MYVKPLKLFTNRRLVAITMYVINCLTDGMDYATSRAVQYVTLSAKTCIVHTCIYIEKNEI